MSWVSGVVLATGSHEPQALRDQVDAWLAGRHGPLRWLEDEFGGPKHPQMRLGAAGLNYLREDEFAALVLSLPWEEPEHVVLLIKPEEGPTRVWRANSPRSP